MLYFRKVIEAGNITAAAESLNVAQPALGAQIKQLENELGLQLVVRHSRGVSATPAGQLLYRHAQRILDGVEQARQELSSIAQNKQLNLRLGVCPSMVRVMGAGLLMDAREALPDVLISLEEERSPVLLDALERDQLDIAFVYDVGERPEVERQAVVEEDLLLITSPANAIAEESISFARALQQDLAIGGERSSIRSVIEAEAQRLSLQLKPAYEVHSVMSLTNLVERGVASTIMPYSLMVRELQEGTLVSCPIVRPQVKRTLYIVRQRARRPSLDDDRIAGYIEKLIQSYTDAIAPWARRLS